MPKEANWGSAQGTGDGEGDDELTGRDGNRQGPRLSTGEEGQWG